MVSTSPEASKILDRSVDVRQVGASLLYSIFIEPDGEQDLVPLRL
jgi:hypothetical protein